MLTTVRQPQEITRWRSSNWRHLDHRRNSGVVITKIFLEILLETSFFRQNIMKPTTKRYVARNNGEGPSELNISPKKKRIVVLFVRQHVVSVVYVKLLLQAGHERTHRFESRPYDMLNESARHTPENWRICLFSELVEGTSAGGKGDDKLK